MSPRVMAALLIIASCAAPVNPRPIYIDAVIEVCADIYEVDSSLCRCIIARESGWNLDAVGDAGLAVGVWQWHEKSIKLAFHDMGIVWDWGDGDPRLNVWASTLAAAHSLSKGWDWWTTREICGGISHD